MQCELHNSYGIEFVRWPDTGGLRERLARAGIPRLLLVQPNDKAPVELDPDEDWVRLPASFDDVESRCRQLAGRVLERHREQPALKDGLVLRRGSDRVFLTPVEALVVTALLDKPGELVQRSQLAALIWEGRSAPSTRALDSVLYRLRRKLFRLGIIVQAVSSRGFRTSVRSGKSSSSSSDSLRVDEIA
jgi:DNA-binding winged helix-turn-helix (wHTH) protein